jgi:phage-related protein
VDVRWHPAAREELRRLPPNERAALLNAEEKLVALGDQLAFPHSSAVRGSTGLRELRPRRGRSPWRALYRRIGGSFVIAAIAPEAQHDSRGFNAAVAAAEQRLNEIVED